MRSLVALFLAGVITATEATLTATRGAAPPTPPASPVPPPPPPSADAQQTSPSRVVLDTLGRIEEDARADAGSLTKYDALAHQCNVTLTRLREQIALDESRLRREHDTLTVDVGRITNAVRTVTTLEGQLGGARRAASRANRTLDDLKSVRGLQVAYFESHAGFLSETQDMLARLHKYLDAPPGHLSRNNAPTAPSLAQLSENMARHRQRLGHYTKSMKALVARSLRGDAASMVEGDQDVGGADGDADGIADRNGRIQPAPHVFHGSFHATLEELRHLLGNATAEYASDKEGSSSYFQAAFDTLHAEVGLQRGKVAKLQAKLDAAREEHRRAVLVMEHVKEGPGDMSRKFLMKNAAAALKATENQCDFLVRAQASRQEHWAQDTKAAEMTRKLVQRMTDDIVTRMSGAR
jgi:hypothetical protein